MHNRVVRKFLVHFYWPAYPPFTYAFRMNERTIVGGKGAFNNRRKSANVVMDYLNDRFEYMTGENAPPLTYVPGVELRDDTNRKYFLDGLLPLGTNCNNFLVRLRWGNITNYPRL
ncbi:unnamed protein product [Somion occarium]|uniref:Uncharacterized protein n=1 Tax=Somion occarium TaxID=3059160 RepID=A0ABP1DF89_9APHY